MQTENNYIETDLGNISPNPCGAYDASATYEYLDLVEFQGGSYLYIAEKPSTGVAPNSGNNTATWQILTLPGDLTPEYVRMHDLVVNLSEQVEADAEETRRNRGAVESMETNVESMQIQTAESAQNAEGSKNQAAGYASAAEISRRAAQQSEQNAAAQVTGFDIHAAEETEKSKNAIESARNTAVATVVAQQNASAQEVKDQTLDYIKQEKEAAKQEIDQKTETFDVDVNAIKQEVATEGTEQVKRIEAAGTREVQSVEAAGTTQSARVMENGEAAIAEMQEILNNVKDTLQSTDEKMIETYYNMKRTGKIYRTRLWLFDTNPSSAGEKLLDNAGLNFSPSTDTEEGVDDYLNGQHPLFEWVDCNYVRDDDGTPRPVSVCGMESFKTSGAVDVGAMQMSFYYSVEPHYAEGYVDITISDMQHTLRTDVHLYPWPECVKADGTVVPWCIGSKYFSGEASDGLLRSQPGLKLALYQSHNNMITNYQKKGRGYWGAGASRNTFQFIFNAIKGATKNSQNLFAGCTAYSWQYEASVRRSDKQKYFPVTNQQAENIIIGSRVYVGYGSVSSGSLSLDRGASTMRKYADLAKVTRIETLDDSNKAVYLDITDGFDTVPVTLSDAVTSPIVMSSMPWHSGTTDHVIGKHDGSIVSNTNGKYPYRVQGREYSPGAYVVAADTVMIFKSDYSKDVYVAPKGVARSTSESDIRSTYKLIGNIPNRLEGSDFWVGDIGIDVSTGGWYPSSIGSGSSQGTGDNVYAGGKSTSGAKEYLQSGFPGSGSCAGFSFLACWGGLSDGGWLCAAAD